MEKYIIHRVDASDAAWRIDNFRFPKNHGFEVLHGDDIITLLPFLDGSGSTDTSWAVTRDINGTPTFCGVLDLPGTDSTERAYKKILSAFDFRFRFSYFNPQDSDQCQSTFIP